MQKSLFQSIQPRWRKMLSVLLVLLTVLGMLPTTALASDATPVYEPTGNFEVNVAGSTGWNAYPMSLSVYDAETDGKQITVIPATDENAPIAFVILEDNGGDRVKVGLAYDGSTLTSWEGGSVTKTGWVDKESIFVNLPDVLPSIAYNLTGREDQYSVRLGRYEYIVPCWYTLAEFLARSQKEAMANGQTLLVYDSGNQTADVNLATGDPAQLHDYEIDGAKYQKYESWTDTNRSGRPDEWQKPFSTPANINRVSSVSPYTAFVDVVGRKNAHRAPARASSNPTGGTGGLNPGSPGGQKPTSNTTAWYTDQERTFLRFTLVEFPEGVVKDLNSNDYNTWHVVGHPLNVVWGKGKIETWNADQCRSKITWFNSCAMQYNGAGSDAKSLMSGTVYSYDATAGENKRWVTTADEFQSESGITDQQKEQMFHCNSSSWTSGWKDGDYTSMWGTDPESVTPGNPYKVYKANDAFIYLLGRLSETGTAGSGWSKEEAIDKWSEYIHDKDGNLRTKYRIIVETGGIVVDPDGVRRAYTLREMMAYTQYNNEPNAKNNLIYDQSSTIKNMSRWMRQSKDNQFLEYPLDGSGVPTGEELHSTNGFREADSFVDSITSPSKIRDTIFSERRSYGLHIFSPFNFESEPPKSDRATLDVTKSAEEGLDTGDGWSFTVTYTSGTPTGFTASKGGTDCTSEVTDTGSGLTFKLKAGETIHLDFEADASFRCEVVEDDTSNLTNVTGTGGTADKDAGKFTTTSSTATVTFTNGEVTEPPPVDPPPETPPPEEPPSGPSGPIVYKRDAMTNSGVGPATFKFASVVNGDYEFTTDANGELEPIQWWNPSDESEGRYIKPGEYAVTEIVPPPNYMPTTEVQQIKLELDDSGNGIPAGPLVFKNLAKVGLKIIKYDRESHQTMAGVSFEIFKDGNSIGRYETNPSGEILLTDIEPGTYRVIEVDTGDDVHILDTSWQEVELIAGEGVKELMFYNDKKPGMRLVKVDSSDPSKTIPGVKFSIRAIDGSFGPQEFTTDQNGEIDLSKLPEGSYEVTEIECPGYVIDEAQRIIHLHPNDVAEFVFTNTKKPSLRLIKTSADGTPLDGVTFKITPIEDASHSIDRTTQNGGEILVDDLDPGVYSVVETATLPDHILDKTEYHVELTPGKTSEIRLKNDKRPWLVISKTDKDTGNPVPGVTFILRGADGPTITTKPTGADGKVTINDLLPGVYTVIEQSVPEDYILDTTPQTVTLFPNRETRLEFQNHQRPTLKIVKVDIAGKHLTGAIFEVKTKAGVKIGDFPVNANGEIEIPKKHLAEGYYIITEIQAPEGYILDKTPHEIYLRPGKTTEVSIENEKKPGLTIHKIDSVVGSGIKGAKFEIYVAKDKNPNGTYQKLDSTFYYTDENGIIHLDNLDTGWYKVVEVEPAPGFTIKEPAEQVIYVEHDKLAEVTFENTPLNAIIVEKYDSVTHTALPGCTFQLRYLAGTSGTGGTVIGQKVTGMNGVAIWTGLQPGTYIVEEVDPADGYSIINSSETVYLADSGEQSVVTVRFDNSPDGNLLIRKVCSVNPSITLQDAEFKVTYADGTLIGDGNGIYRTDEHGEIRIEGLKPGKSVIVTETRAPAGFIIDTQSQTVQIKEGRTVSLTFKNQPRGKMIIQKRDSVTGDPLPGAEFRVTTAAGCEVGLDGVIGTATLTQNGLFRTDSNGEIRLSNLAPGAYVITETKAPSGYVMDAPSTNVVIGPNGDTQTVIITNTKKGGLIVEKYDSVTKQPLRGATFKITTAAGNLVADNEGLTSSNGLYTTDVNGQIVLSKLLPGTYVVAEEKAPDHYRKDPTPQTVVVNAADTQTLRFYDDPLCTLTILKRDAVTKKPLAKAEFLVRDSEGKAIGPNNGSYITGSDGTVTVTGLEPNATIVVSETKAPSGYILDESAT